METMDTCYYSLIQTQTNRENLSGLCLVHFVLFWFRFYSVPCYGLPEFVLLVCFHIISFHTAVVSSVNHTVYLSP